MAKASPSLSVSLASRFALPPEPFTAVLFSVVDSASFVPVAVRSSVMLSVSVVVPPKPSSTVKVMESTGCDPVGAASIAAVLSAV